MVFGDIAKLGVGIVTLLIVLVVGFLISSEGRDQIGSVEGITVTNATQCATSVACNATNTMNEAVEDIPGWVPVIVITAIGGILLSMTKVFRA